jgi:hypothetical protein
MQETNDLQVPLGKLLEGGGTEALKDECQDLEMSLRMSPIPL